MTVDKHAEQHGEIKAKLESMEKSMGKVTNGKQVDLIVKGAVAVLGLLELQERTGVEIGTARDMPAAFIKMLLAFVGG